MRLLSRYETVGSRIPRRSLTTVFVSVICSSALATNLVQNGSFESPISNNRFGSNPATWFNGQTFGGYWNVFQANIDIVRTPYSPLPAAYEGVQYIDLNGTTTLGGVYQDIFVGSAGVYTLSFAQHGNYSFNRTIPRTMSVAFGSLFSGSYTHRHGDPWRLYSVTLTINTPGTYRLSFVSTTSTNAEGPLVDDVRLELVPEPASLTVIGIGLASLLKRRRR
jgi:hypothetical protein